MVGFVVIYVFKIFGNLSMLLVFFINVLYFCGSIDFNVFKVVYFEWGIVVLIVIFFFLWVFIRRRDVV